MKKYLQLLVAFVLMLAIVGIARYGSAWASSQLPSPIAAGMNSPLETAVTITGSGTYNVGGVCTLAVTYNISGLQITRMPKFRCHNPARFPFLTALKR